MLWRAIVVLYGGLELECPSGEYKLQKGNVKKIHWSLSNFGPTFTKVAWKPSWSHFKKLPADTGKSTVPFKIIRHLDLGGIIDFILICIKDIRGEVKRHLRYRYFCYLTPEPNVTITILSPKNFVSEPHFYGTVWYFFRSGSGSSLINEEQSEIFSKFLLQRWKLHSAGRTGWPSGGCVLKSTLATEIYELNYLHFRHG